MSNLSLECISQIQFKNTCKTLTFLQFYDGGIMFMGSYPFGGMLGSCRREGLCMLTLIAEMGKLIMLIKQALAYGNKSVTLKHFQKKSGSIGEEHIKGETSLNKLICLRFCSTLNGCFCALICFVCFGLLKETLWQLHNTPKYYTVKWTDTCEGDRSSSNAISISDV